MNSLSFLAHPWYVSWQLVVSLYSCLHLVSSVLTYPVVSLSSFSRPSLPFSLSLLLLRASARAPILIIEVQVRPVKIVHYVTYSLESLKCWQTPKFVLTIRMLQTSLDFLPCALKDIFPVFPSYLWAGLLH